MPYDAETDSYTCPAGKRLRPQYDTVRTSGSDGGQRLSVYVCESCAGWPMKAKCTKAKESLKMTQGL